MISSVFAIRLSSYALSVLTAAAAVTMAFNAVRLCIFSSLKPPVSRPGRVL